MKEVKSRAKELSDTYTQEMYPKINECRVLLVDLFKDVAKEDEEIAFLLVPRFKALSKELKKLEREMHYVFIKEDGGDIEL